MANEVTVTAQLRVIEGNLDTQRQGAANVQFDLTGAAVDSGVQNIGTSEENIALVNVSSPAWCFIRNLDSTNYVQVGQDNASTMRELIRLPAGGIAVFPMDAGLSALRCKANTAACDVYYVIVGT